jgi:PadR family transcriptional regulator, regulatory protein PadR
MIFGAWREILFVRQKRIGNRFFGPAHHPTRELVRDLKFYEPSSRAPKTPVDGQKEYDTLTFSPVDGQKECMPTSKSEVLQGTLDLLVLKTLDSMGPMHGFGIALRIQQVSEDLLQLNQGTLYPALLRLEQRGWISSKWGVSENNRKAKYYSLVRAGRRQLEEEAENWGRMSAMINRVLRAS